MITCVITMRVEVARIQAAYLIRSEAVAKFSSFRQLRVSTINNFLAVMRVTLLRDARQHGFVARRLPKSRASWVSHQSHDADCITRSPAP